MLTVISACACECLAGPVPVTVTVTNSPGYAIPATFAGLSFGAVSELPGHGGVPGLMFNPTNEQLIALFKNSGLHHLRLGGSTVEGVDRAIPSQEAIDDVFGFAKAADIKVTYSLPLLNGDAASNAVTAKYIWDHYRPWLDDLAIANEPDIKRYSYPPFGSGTDPAITNYSSYLSQWRIFTRAIRAAVPGVKFAGPDAAGRFWAAQFAADEKDSGLVDLITQHFYVGGRPYVGDTTQTIPVPEAIDHILSTNWLYGKYQTFYQGTIVPIRTNGVPYRMTELDDYLKGVPNASDSFATALWALDYLHWWAERGCVGVNFHNTEWLKTDTIFFDDATHSYRINPKAYGIKAFELGSHGSTEPVAIDNAGSLNLTAYAVGDRRFTCVTIINKEHGENARDAAVMIAPAGFARGTGAIMLLTTPNHDASAMTGMTLGGGTITNNAPWTGRWMPLKPAAGGRYEVDVPAASAAIIRLATR